MLTEMLNYQKNRTGLRVEAPKRWDARAGNEGLGRIARETPGNIERGVDELMSFVDYFLPAESCGLELLLVNS